MKRWILLFLLLTTQAVATPYKHIVFFGDSISDNGNFYRLLFKIIPKSPPYYQGRFSNGPTWAEYVAQHYVETDKSSYKIYAVAGATAIFHSPSSHFIDPSTLGIQLQHYYLDSLFQKKDDVLFFIWIGGNDYVFDASIDSDTLSTKVVNQIAWSVNNLISRGAKHIVIMNLPDISRAPLVKDRNLTDMVAERIKLHNDKFTIAANTLIQDNPNIDIKAVNVFDIFNNFYQALDTFNQKYGTHINNVTDSCWKMGLVFNLRPTINTYTVETPDIAEAYRVGKLADDGEEPCNNPDDYLFWDSLHPTAAAHKAFSQVVLEKLNV